MLQHAFQGSSKVHETTLVSAQVNILVSIMLLSYQLPSGSKLELIKYDIQCRQASTTASRPQLELGLHLCVWDQLLKIQGAEVGGAKFACSLTQFAQQNWCSCHPAFGGGVPMSVQAWNCNTLTNTGKSILTTRPLPQGVLKAMLQQVLKAVPFFCLNTCPQNGNNVA